MKHAMASLVLMFTKGHSADQGRLRHKLAGWVFRRFPGQISCADFEAFLLDYYEVTLPEPQRVLFEGHLRLCSQCRASLNGYIRSIQLGQRLFETDEGPLPDDVPEHIVSAVSAAMRAG